MRRFALLPLAAALSLATLTAAQAAPLSRDADHVYRPTGRGQGEIDEEATQRQRADVAAGRARVGSGTVRGAGINYHGGPVMNGLTKVYLLYYGTWTATQTGLMNGLIQTLGGTPIYNTNISYYSLAGTVKSPVQNSVTLMGSRVESSYSLGKTLSDANIQTLVANALTAGWFAKDSNAVYFVLTAPDVKESSGFGSQYCGWHTHGSIGGTDIKYSFVGNAATIAPAGCGVVNPSPNGDGGIDAMASVVFHELSETVSDPDLNAWYDTAGAENADKCAWTFGTLLTAAGGAKYNVSFGGRNWKLQQNWVNAGTGYCSLAY
jgi:hypothetical protein